MKSAQGKTNNAFEFLFQVRLFSKNALDHILFGLNMLINNVNVHLTPCLDRRCTETRRISTIILSALNRARQGMNANSVAGWTLTQSMIPIDVLFA